MASPAMPGSADRAASAPHIVLLPSAGMGHLVPFSRLAVALSGHGCNVSVVTVLPTVSSAESSHFAKLFAAFPAVCRLDLRLAPFDASAFPGADPFFVRFEAMRRSAPLLGPLLAGSKPRASALVTDIAIASSVLPVARELRLPCYILFTSSATMFCLVAHFPTYLATKAVPGIGDVDIPGVCRIPESSIPQALHDPNHLFTAQFVENSREIAKADGVLLNTFKALEPEAVAALQEGKVVPGFPPVFPVGTLIPVSFPAEDKAKKDSPNLAWLDAQPARSVVYVSFGSRKAIAKDQLKELAIGLEASGFRFLWVVKTTVVDREDDAELNELLGEAFMELLEGRGVAAKGWVEQEEVLRHPAIGLFISHCGWNSVTEAAACGVPVLAWPRSGDQRVNAGVVARGGVGVWVERWSWEREEGVVSGEEIASKVKEVMGDKAVREKAATVGQEAAMAIADGGTSYRSLSEFVAKLKV